MTAPAADRAVPQSVLDDAAAFDAMAADACRRLGVPNPLSREDRAWIAEQHALDLAIEAYEDARWPE